MLDLDDVSPNLPLPGRYPQPPSSDVSLWCSNSTTRFVIQSPGKRSNRSDETMGIPMEGSLRTDRCLPAVLGLCRPKIAVLTRPTNVDRLFRLAHVPFGYSA